ncbi:MAG: hypothetical protein IJV19_06560 [Prevotella sp.]|nr:hypothetical protein [Prevotella sp.]
MNGNKAIAMSSAIGENGCETNIHIGFCIHTCIYTRVAQFFLAFEKKEACCKFYYLPDYFAKAEYEVPFYQYPPVVFVTKGSLQITEASYFMDIPVLMDKKDVMQTGFCFVKEYQQTSCGYSYRLYHNGKLHNAYRHESEIIRRYFANCDVNEEHAKEMKAVYKLDDVRCLISQKKQEIEQYVDSISMEELLKRLSIFRFVEAGPYKIGEGRDFEIKRTTTIDGLTDPYLISCFGIGTISEYSEVMSYAYSNPWDDYLREKYPRGAFSEEKLDEERRKCLQLYNRESHIKWLLDDYIQSTFFPKPKKYSMLNGVINEYNVEIILLNMVREKKHYKDTLSKIDKIGNILMIGEKALEKLNQEVRELSHLVLKDELEYKQL